MHIDVLGLTLAANFKALIQRIAVAPKKTLYKKDHLVFIGYLNDCVSNLN